MPLSPAWRSHCFQGDDLKQVVHHLGSSDTAPALPACTLYSSPWRPPTPAHSAKQLKKRPDLGAAAPAPHPLNPLKLRFDHQGGVGVPRGSVVRRPERWAQRHVPEPGNQWHRPSVNRCHAEGWRAAPLSHCAGGPRCRPGTVSPGSTVEPVQVLQPLTAAWAQRPQVRHHNSTLAPNTGRSRMRRIV